MFNEKCNAYLKTRAGLKGLLATYDLPGITVESAIGAEHLAWSYTHVGSPNEDYLEAWNDFCENKCVGWID